MISPELLRRYRFFWCMDDGQQKAVAMIADHLTYPSGGTIYEEDQPADRLYLLVEGNVRLLVALGDQELCVDDVGPGEPFGLCSLLPDQTYTSTARANVSSRVIRIDAKDLRALYAADCSLGVCLMQQVARSALEQVRTTHVRLASLQA